MAKSQLLGAFASSEDPTEISNRVKGVVLALSSVIILVGTQFFHVTLSANDVVSLASSLGTIAGAIWAVWGGILALVRFFGSVKSV